MAGTRCGTVIIGRPDPNTMKEAQPERETSSLPKTIWAFWDQGEDQAPWIVRRCLDSWRLYNPGWNFRVLDRDSVPTELGIEAVLARNRPYIQIQQYADLLRGHLLKAYGGVWVDSTCFCCKPLDTWIADYVSSGFFAFKRNDATVPLSNWFLAGNCTSYIVRTWIDAYDRYWRDFDFSRQTHSNKVRNVLRILLFKVPCLAGVWNQPVFLRLMKCYPYYSHHHVFGVLVKKDPVFRQAWGQVPEFSTTIPHCINREGFLNPLSATAQASIDELHSPVYKLRHSFDCPDSRLADPRTNLGYLLRRHGLA